MNWQLVVVYMVIVLTMLGLGCMALWGFFEIYCALFGDLIPKRRIKDDK